VFLSEGQNRIDKYPAISFSEFLTLVQNFVKWLCFIHPENKTGKPKEFMRKFSWIQGWPNRKTSWYHSALINLVPHGSEGVRTPLELSPGLWKLEGSESRGSSPLSSWEQAEWRGKKLGHAFELRAGGEAHGWALGVEALEQKEDRVCWRTVGSPGMLLNKNHSQSECPAFELDPPQASTWKPHLPLHKNLVVPIALEFVFPNRLQMTSTSRWL
jgi:hypothetical protein